MGPRTRRGGRGGVARGGCAYLWVRGLESHGDRLPRFSRRVRSPGVVRWIPRGENPKPDCDSRSGESMDPRPALRYQPSGGPNPLPRKKGRSDGSVSISSRRPVEPKPRAPGTHGSAHLPHQGKRARFSPNPRTAPARSNATMTTSSLLRPEVGASGLFSRGIPGPSSAPRRGPVAVARLDTLGTRGCRGVSLRAAPLVRGRVAVGFTAPRAIASDKIPKRADDASTPSELEEKISSPDPGDAPKPPSAVIDVQSMTCL